MTIYEGCNVSPGMPGVCAAVRAGSLIKNGHPLCLQILSKTTFGWDMTHFYVPFLDVIHLEKAVLGSLVNVLYILPATLLD